MKSKGNEAGILALKTVWIHIKQYSITNTRFELYI